MDEKLDELWRDRAAERRAAMKVVNDGIMGCLTHDQKSRYVVAMSLLLLAEATDPRPVIEITQNADQS